MKLENLLITKKGHIVLCDFGLSCKLANGEKTAKGFVGTIYYMSPELLTAESYNKSVDYWSLGILTCEFCFAKHPFDVENGCTAERAYCLLKLDPDIPKNLNDHTKVWDSLLISI